MHVRRTAVLGLAALTGLATLAGTAQALTTVTIDKCLAAQIKIVRKAPPRRPAATRKAASKGLPVDGECLSKASVKITSGLDKLRRQAGLSRRGHERRAPDQQRVLRRPRSTRRSATRRRSVTPPSDSAVGKYVARADGLLSRKPPARPAPSTRPASRRPSGSSLPRSRRRRRATIARTSDRRRSCRTTRARSPNPRSARCRAAGLRARPAATAWNDPGEPCDASASPAGWEQCGPEFTWHRRATAPVRPRSVFSGDANAPETILDTGWTGISHRTPIIGNGDVTVQLELHGHDPAVRHLPGERPGRQSGRRRGAARQPALQHRLVEEVHLGRRLHRSHVSRRRQPRYVVRQRQRMSGAGRAPRPASATSTSARTRRSAGGVALCVVNQFAAPVSGRRTSRAARRIPTVLLTSRVYFGPAVDVPCPRCTDNGGINDGTNGGTCDGGPRAGLACDSNGAVPGRPDFGRTSLDCPPLQGALAATLGIDLSNATDPVAKTLTVNSPNCSGTTWGQVPHATPATTATPRRATTTPIVPIRPRPDRADLRRPPLSRGSRNAGAACGASSECPGSGLAAVPASRPDRPRASTTRRSRTASSNARTPMATARAPATIGPIDQTCTLHSGHAQRRLHQHHGLRWRARQLRFPSPQLFLDRRRHVPTVGQQRRHRFARRGRHGGPAGRRRARTRPSPRSSVSVRRRREPSTTSWVFPARAA